MLCFGLDQIPSWRIKARLWYTGACSLCIKGNPSTIFHSGVHIATTCLHIKSWTAACHTIFERPLRTSGHGLLGHTCFIWNSTSTGCRALQWPLSLEIWHLSWSRSIKSSSKQSENTNVHCVYAASHAIRAFPWNKILMHSVWPTYARWEITRSFLMATWHWKNFKAIRNYYCSLCLCMCSHSVETFPWNLITSKPEYTV